MVLLYLTLGYSALIGGVVILLLSPLQYKLAQCFSGIQKKTLVSVECSVQLRRTMWLQERATGLAQCFSGTKRKKKNSTQKKTLASVLFKEKKEERPVWLRFLWLPCSFFPGWCNVSLACKIHPQCAWPTGLSTESPTPQSSTPLCVPDTFCWDLPSTEEWARAPLLDSETARNSMLCIILVSKRLVWMTHTCCGGSGTQYVCVKAGECSRHNSSYKGTWDKYSGTCLIPICLNPADSFEFYTILNQLLKSVCIVQFEKVLFEFCVRFPNNPMSSSRRQQEVRFCWSQKRGRGRSSWGVVVGRLELITIVYSFLWVLGGSRHKQHAQRGLCCSIRV